MIKTIIPSKHLKEQLKFNLNNKVVFRFVFSMLFLCLYSCNSQNSSQYRQKIQDLERDNMSLLEKNNILQNRCDSLQVELDKYKGLINTIRESLNR